MKTVLTFAVALLFTATSDAAVLNGSFENGTLVSNGQATMSLGTGATDILNWVVSADRVAWIGAGNPFGVTAYDGSRFLDLTDYQQSGHGAVSQTISTSPGMTYLVSFAQGASSLWGASAVVVAAAGQSQSFSITPVVVNEWHLQSWSFIANSTSTVISFTGGPIGTNYIGLDAVTIDAGTAAVPEPGTMGLLALGVLGLCWRRTAS